MRPICPGCASPDAYEVEPGRYVCPCRHEFKTSEALVSFSGVIRFAKVFAHPTRVTMLFHLSRVPAMSSKELSELLDEPLGDISYHMRMMANQKPEPLVTPVEKKAGNGRRGAIETFYRVNPEIVGAF